MDSRFQSDQQMTCYSGQKKKKKKKASTVIEFIRMIIPAYSFAIPPTGPTSLQHTAFFMFSVSFPTVTLCFRTENRAFKQTGHV